MSAYAELHDDLRAVARDVLASSSAPDWALLASTGWLGLEVPEDHDGAGVTFAEVAVVLQEMGRAAAATPYLGGVVLGAAALREAGADDLLASVASGARRVAVVLPTGDDPTLTFELTGGRLHGAATFVPDVPGADDVLVVTHRELVLAGVEWVKEPVLDATRRVATVRADGAEPNEVWPLPAGAASRLLDRAATAVALDSLGVAEAMLDATVAYVKVRQQFDQPIGSFQAVKHACADMLVAVTVGRELVAEAVAAVAEDRPGAWIASARAKSLVTASAVDVVGKALQLHGGIGYTWESGVHAYLKRATFNRSLFGSPRAHRKRLAGRYAAPPTGGDP